MSPCQAQPGQGPGIRDRSPGATGSASAWPAVAACSNGGAVRGTFDQRLAAQENPALRYPHIETETRRGKDHVAVTVLMTVHAPDLAQALTAAWDAFRQAAGDDTAGWDIASATAHVWPEA